MSIQTAYAVTQSLPGMPHDVDVAQLFPTHQEAYGAFQGALDAFLSDGYILQFAPERDRAFFCPTPTSHDNVIVIRIERRAVTA